MKLPDIFKMAFHNLWIRKLRTALNLVGIVIASVLLLATLAATEGIQDAVVRFVESSEHSKRFRIYPDFDRSVKPPPEAVKVEGEMSERRRKRLRDLLENNWREENQPRWYWIPPGLVEKIRKLPHVVEVSPKFSINCDIEIDGTLQKTFARSCSSLNLSLRQRMIAGEMIGDDNSKQILIHEGLAYKLGFRSDSDLEELIGKTVVLKFPVNAGTANLFGAKFFSESVEKRIQWFKVLEHLLSGKSVLTLGKEEQDLIKQFLKQQEKPSASPKFQVLKIEFEVAGVFRRRDDQDIQNVLERFTGGFGDVLFHHHVFENDLKEVLGKRGAHDADVFVDEYPNLKTVIEETEKNSVRVASPADIINRVVAGVENSKFTIGTIVLIVLFISAIGISNTMFMSLVERTEEIGILKAVGGSNRDVLHMILFEGLVTGLIGSLVSIGISFLVVLVGNEMLRNYVEYRSTMELEGQLFQVEGWMIAAMVAMATLTTTVAGLWPAWRASRLDPVDAMGQR